jgi:hypothetical protein
MARLKRLDGSGAPASVPSTPPTDRERIEWALAFLRRDVDTLRRGEWLDLRHDVQHYIWPPMALGASDFEDAVRLWHRELRRVLELASTERGCDLSTPITRTLTRFQAQGDGRLLAVHAPMPLPIALLSAGYDLLAQWYQQLRRCERCQTWFLPAHGRQRFHDLACAAQARWSKFAPTRRRDYHAEYVKRVRRVAPGARPARRPRTKGGSR